MSNYITPRDLNALRQLSSDWMASECKVFRAVAPVFDPDDPLGTSFTDPNTDVVLYEGVCRVTPSGPGTEVMIGDELVVMRNVAIYLPWDAAVPMVDDFVLVTASSLDSELEGRQFRIAGVRAHQENVSRELTCVGLQRSPRSGQI